MDALVIANIEDATATSEFLKSQRAMIDEAYSNKNSYLYAGQQKSDSYMQMKQRVPMVMEFYLTPEELYTVEMYINPQKMSFSHTKLIGKQVTKGGIFFHHYGEDAPKLTIQGNTGLSNMRGIEQLEKVFNYSGTLLRYQNVGVNKIDNGVAEPRNIISLNDVIAEFDAKVQSKATSIQNTTEQQVSITETSEQLFEQANVVFSTGEGLYSKAKAAQMVGFNLKLLYNSIDWSNKLAQLKSVIVKTNQIMSGKQGSFKDIYYVVLDLCTKETGFQDPSLDAMAFQIAYRMYSDQVGEVDDNLSANVDTTTLTMDMFVSQTSKNVNINNNTKNNASIELKAEESNLVNVYKCKEYAKLYAEPSFSSNVLGELKVDGEFTAYVNNKLNKPWVQHITGGYAMTNLPSNAKAVLRVTEEGNKLSELHMCVDPNKGYQESNYAKDNTGSNYTFYPGGFFTYSKSVVSNHVTWFQHEKTGYWIPSGIYINNVWNRILDTDGKEYLHLEHENCYIYTAIRDDIKTYSEPDTSKEIKTEDGKSKFLYKGGKFTADKKQDNWIKHIGENVWCQLKNNDQNNFLQGYTGDKNNIIETGNSGTMVVGENHMPDILTSNNDITLAVQESINDCTNGFQQYLSDVRVWNKNSVIKRFEIESGIADIYSELTDEWLPRLVFLYFEDRVFLGHFDAFNYDRVAETENISYNMTFTIQRIISVTSISPSRFEQSSLMQNDLENLGLPQYSEYEESLEYFASQYALGNDLPLKIEILRTKCKYFYEKAVADYTGVKMTDERVKSITAHHERLLQCSVYDGQQRLTKDTPIYGNVENTNYEEYINFMTLGYIQENEIYRVPLNELGLAYDSDTWISTAQGQLDLKNRIDGQFISPTMLQQDWCIAKYNDIIIPELQRVNKIWTEESNSNYVDERKAASDYAKTKAHTNSFGFMTIGNTFKDFKEYVQNIRTTRVQELFEHAQNLIFAIGARYANNSDFRQIYNNWLWQYNNYYGGSYPVQSTYKNKNAKITATIASNEVYERTFKLTYDNTTYKFQVLNFDKNAKQNFAPVRYILETVLNCQCGWNAEKKRAICITDKDKILLDIETYLHTTVDEKTGQTTPTAYCPLSVLFQYLNFDYVVDKNGASATLRQEGITHINEDTTNITVSAKQDTKVAKQEKTTEKLSIKEQTQKEADTKQQEKEEYLKNNNITVTDDWDKSKSSSFAILNCDKTLVVNKGKSEEIRIGGFSQDKYVLSYVKNGRNNYIKLKKVSKEDGVITYRISGVAVGQQSVTFVREANGKIDNKITLNVKVIAADADLNKS